MGRRGISYKNKTKKYPHNFMKITIPEGLVLDVGPGETTELLTKVQVSEDGKEINFISIDDVPLPEDKDEKDTEEEEQVEEGDMSDQDIDALTAGLAAPQEQEVPSQEDYMASRQ